MEVSLNFINRYVRLSVKNALKKADCYYIENIFPFHNWKIGELEGNNLKNVIESYLIEGKHFILNQNTGRQIEILKNAIEKYLRKKKDIPDNEIDALNKIFKDCKNKITHKDWLKIKEKYQELKNDEFKEKFLNYSYDENEKFEDSNESNKTNTVSSTFSKKSDVFDNQEIYSDTDVLHGDLKEVLDSLNTEAEWVIDITENNTDDYDYQIVIINFACPSENLYSFIPHVKQIIKSVSHKCNIYTLVKNNVNCLKGYFNLD